MQAVCAYIYIDGVKFSMLTDYNYCFAYMVLTQNLRLSSSYRRTFCYYRWGGPLPQSWLDQQLALQKLILSRMVELGMTPGKYLV